MTTITLTPAETATVPVATVCISSYDADASEPVVRFFDLRESQCPNQGDRTLDLMWLDAVYSHDPEARELYENEQCIRIVGVWPYRADGDLRFAEAKTTTMTTNTEPKQLYEVCIERNATRKEYFTALVLADSEDDALERADTWARAADLYCPDTLEQGDTIELEDFEPVTARLHDPVANPPQTGMVIGVLPHHPETGAEQGGAMEQEPEPEVISVGISVEGGQITSVFSPTHRIAVTVYDYDTEGADPGDIKQVLQASGKWADALVWEDEDKPWPLLTVREK